MRYGTLLQAFALALVAPLLGGCAQAVYARRAFEVTYACPAGSVTSRPTGYRSPNYTPITVMGCGHVAEYDCTFISGYPVATPDDVACTERVRLASESAVH